MPKYTFYCESCNASEQKYTSPSTESVECIHCKKQAHRKLPTLNGPSNVTEVIDKYTGVTHRPNQREEVEQRRAEYYWTVEVPRFVESGTYSIETMLENGWIWVDDNNQVHINNKPPQRR
jgi:hypothetical protein